eukprot:COSAG04_NODE_1702_length_5888_cov_2.061323_5_plen_53_part_00
MHSCQACTKLCGHSLVRGGSVKREKGMPDVVRAAVQHEETLLQSGLRRGMKT